MTRFLVFLLIGWVSVILQAAAVSPLFSTPHRPDLPFVIVLFLALSVPLYPGLILSLVMGYMVGVLSGAPHTLVFLVYALCFGMVRPVGWLLSPSSRVLHIVLPLVLTPLKGGLLLAGGYLLSRGMGPRSWILQGALWEAALNAVAALALFPALEYLLLRIQDSSENDRVSLSRR